MARSQASPGRHACWSAMETGQEKGEVKSEAGRVITALGIGEEEKECARVACFGLVNVAKVTSSSHRPTCAQPQKEETGGARVMEEVHIGLEASDLVKKQCRGWQQRPSNRKDRRVENKEEDEEGEEVDSRLDLFIHSDRALKPCDA